MGITTGRKRGGRYFGKPHRNDYRPFELYCTDKACDCRRAMIQVQDPTGTLFATLSYGWENRQFYIDWMYGDTVGIDDLPGINLYSLQPQSEYAGKFLDLFREMMKDQSLAERYQRHYAQFKAALQFQKANSKAAPEIVRQQRRDRRFDDATDRH